MCQLADYLFSKKGYIHDMTLAYLLHWRLMSETTASAWLERLFVALMAMLMAC
jgi:hypothetical protein